MNDLDGGCLLSELVPLPDVSCCRDNDIDDGTRIVTSALANTKLATSNAVVVTKSGSKYKLGTPNPNVKVVEDVEDDEEDRNRVSRSTVYVEEGGSVVDDACSCCGCRRLRCC